MKVGDRVQIDDNSSHSGKVGTITADFIGTAKSAWYILLDDGTKWTAYESSLILISSAINSTTLSNRTKLFIPGDRVIADWQGKQEAGTVMNVVSQPPDCYEVLLDSGNTDLYHVQFLTLEPVSATRPFLVGDRVLLSGLYVSGMGAISKIIIGASGGIVQYEITLDSGMVYSALQSQLSHLTIAPAVNYTINPVPLAAMRKGFTGAGAWTDTANPNLGQEVARCNHSWRLYRGLVEKYEYCDRPGCKAQRDTDRWE